jgi:hypothetical protein
MNLAAVEPTGVLRNWRLRSRPHVSRTTWLHRRFASTRHVVVDVITQLQRSVSPPARSGTLSRVGLSNLGYYAGLRTRVGR